MTSGSRKSILVGLGVLALMALFPPWDSLECHVDEWNAPGNRPTRKTIRLEPVTEYALFVSAPELYVPDVEGLVKPETSYRPNISWDRLVLQWVIVLLASAAAALFFVPDPDGLGPEAGGEDEPEDKDEALVEEKLRAARVFQRSGKLKETRRGMGLSSGDLAEKLGVKLVEVSQWESGRKRMPLKYAVLLLDLRSDELP